MVAQWDEQLFATLAVATARRAGDFSG